MQDLLSNPAVQGGVIPFGAAFVVALILSRFGAWAGLASVVGLLSVVALTTGIEFTPLTSTRKIVLLALITPVIAIGFQLIQFDLKQKRFIGVALAVAAALWLIWPYLGRQETSVMMITGVGISVFVAWLVFAFLSLHHASMLAAGSAVAATGFGVGGAALLGASALLGQMGIAIAVSGLAIIAVFLLVKKEPRSGYMVTLIPGVLLALVSTSAVIYARMPWYTLIVIGAIPILAKIGLSNDQKPLLRAIIWFGIGMMPALLAVGLSWNAEGDSIY